MRVLKKNIRLIYTLVLKNIFFLLEIVLPKNKNYWCFCTWQGYPHTMDNPRAIFEVVKNDPKITKIILLKDDGVHSAEGV